MIPTLLPLLTGGLGKLPFGKLLSGILGGKPADALKEELKERLDVQEGRTGGKMLARGVCEAIDNAMEADSLDPEAAIKLGEGLARNAALQAAEAAEALLAYAELQAVVVKAKRGNLPILAEARRRRDVGLERVKQAFIDVQRVASGNDPREVK